MSDKRSVVLLTEPISVGASALLLKTDAIPSTSMGSPTGVPVPWAST